MRRHRIATALASALAATVLTCGAYAHQSIAVLDSAYTVIVGLLVNPAYSGQLNGIDLAVRDAGGQAVTGLEKSLTAVVIAPDGSELTLTLRANSAKEGWYTGNFIPSVQGNYTFRVGGFIGTESFEAYFDEPAHSDPAVLDASTITVP
ncbi:MAG TPA: hypothetical protein PKN52_09060 [Trueperaceae bacterium]|nr:hypothetical protein [Trueperaceae bacterium]